MLWKSRLDIGLPLLSLIPDCIGIGMAPGRFLRRVESLHPLQYHGLLYTILKIFSSIKEKKAYKDRVNSPNFTFRTYFNLVFSQKSRGSDQIPLFPPNLFLTAPADLMEATNRKSSASLEADAAWLRLF